MASGNFPTGNPIQSLVNPYTLSGNIVLSSGRMMEIGGQSMMKPAETVSLPPRPMARSTVMRQKEEEVFDDGVTMNLLRLQEEGGGGRRVGRSPREHQNNNGAEIRDSD
ncbi:hypothetical protein ZIOFF_050795 [Zingiber officinale]|uniref:Uncharacterized protein n=1 Tax=Zingiber officinale TaxID=94328 RepID=A0A8J5FHN9_ZINOF|nr:hypothetical protein ZIOFF_050795 [Zingiber officinale]